MRTYELIQLLRRNEHASNRLVHLEQLGPRGVLHLLGELCKWLLSEFAKYRRRQEGLDAPEVQSQAALRSDAWRSIKAIQFVLTFIENDTTSPTASPIIAEPPAKKAKIVLHEEEIMDNLVKAMVTGCRPLGPQVDSTKIQLACAKTLRHCLTSATKHPPFPPETLLQRLLILSDMPPGTGEDVFPNPLESIVLLLDSDTKKLQDYGLQLLLSHRSLLQNDIAWQALPAIHTILDQLKADLNRRDDQSPPSTIEQESEPSPPQEPPVDQAQEHLQFSIYVNALHALQYFLKELCKEPVTTSSHPNLATGSGEHHILTHAARLSLLEDVIPIKLVWDLWTLVQHVLLLGQSIVPQRDRLMIATTANVYWYSWCLPASSIPFLIKEGSDTLMGWYALYITEHDGDLEARKGNESTLSVVLEFLTKLILQTFLVSDHQLLLVEGDRPLILPIIRRTIEFLEEIPPREAIVLDEEPEDTQDLLTSRRLTYPLKIIRARQGLLDSMFNILLRSLLLFNEGMKLVPQTRLVESLLFILSSMDEILPRDSTPPSTEAHTKQHLLEVLILLFQSSYIRLNDISRDTWERSSQKLVDWMMLPIEQEALNEDVEMGVDVNALDTLARIEPEPPESKRASGKELMPALQSMRLFRLIWLHLTPLIRGVLANCAGPRIFQLRNIRPLLNIQQGASVSSSSTPPLASTTATTLDGNDTRRREMLSILLDMMAHFGKESSVRINMRDYWAALVFLECMLGAALQSLMASQFSSDNTKDRMVLRKVLEAMRQFWFDQTGLERLVGIRVDALTEMGLRLDSMVPLWPTGMLPSTNDPQGQVSVIPLLLKILLPPRIEPSYQLAFRYPEMKEVLSWHPLYEQRDPIVIDASILLERLCQSTACQHYLVAHPGVVWCLSRMIMERSLIEFLELQKDIVREDEAAETGGGQPLGEPDPTRIPDGAASAAATSSPSSSCNSPRSPRLGSLDDSMNTGNSKNHAGISDSFERIVFRIISKLMSSSTAVKAFVGNNTITEIFGAMVILQHNSLFASHMPLRLSSSSSSSPSPSSAVTADKKGEEEEMTCLFPCVVQQAFLSQLLTHFNTVVQPTRWQFDSLYQFVGGRSALDLDQQVEAVFWLREYAAVASFYMMKDWPAEALSSNMKEGNVAVHPTSDFLSSETVYGDICRMLTLEMDYEEDEEEPKDLQPSLDSLSTNATQDFTSQWRRFSAATALQTKSWAHASAWQAHFLQWRQGLATVYTDEWQAHVARLTASTSSGPQTRKEDALVSTSRQKPITFIIGTQRQTFPNRALLARSSPFFASLLEGAYREAGMDEIQIHDVNAASFEMMLETIKESQWTSKHLLPPDLAVEAVLRLLVCAERFQVSLVKRLAEAWIADTLVRQARAQYFDCWLPSSSSSPPPDERSSDGGVVGTCRLEDTLVQVYSTCSSLAYGSFDEPTHPYYDLLWNTLRLMLLHLGSVAVRPGFRVLWEDDVGIGFDALGALADPQPLTPEMGTLSTGVGGQDKIQAFLQAVTKLIKFG